MSTNQNRINLLVADQKMTDAVQKHLSHIASLPVGSQQVSPADIVKVFEDRLGHTYPDMPWEPKAAFTALAEYYRG